MIEALARVWKCRLKPYFGAGILGRDRQAVHVHGEDGEDVAVRAMARRRGGAAEAGLRR